MDFKDQIRQIGERVLKSKEASKTEEATKTAFVMPLLQALGYDVFNPAEVVPEYITDVGTKKGEKVDYAIMQNDVPIILIECKHWKENLSIHDGQLLRYFHVSKAKFAILTNGILYRFYTDLEEPNKMDEKPFLEFDITDPKETQIEELKKFHKTHFDIDGIFNTAGELKYTSALKLEFHRELNEPSDAFIKHFVKLVYSKNINQKVLDQFSALIKKSISQYITEMITERLKNALSRETLQVSTPQGDPESSPQTPEVASGVADANKIETTEEELQGFFIVKSIVRQHFDVKRVGFRDNQSYFSIIIDDSNRKILCRLYLNGKKKYIGTFDSNKTESKTEIQSLDDIFNCAEALIETAKQYQKV